MRTKQTLTRVISLLALACLVPAVLPAQSLEAARKLETEGRTAEAVRLYTEWLGMNGQHGDYVRVLLHTSSLMTDSSGTVNLLSGALEKVPDGAGRNEILKTLAQLEEMMGRMEEAQRHFDEASYAEPGRKDYRSLLSSAQLLLSLGDTEGAEARSRAIMLTCDDEQIVRSASILYARLFSVLEQYAQGIETLEKVRRSGAGGETPAVLFLLGWLYAKDGKTAEADTVFSLLASRFPDSPEAGLLPGGQGKENLQLYPEPSLLFEFAWAAAPNAAEKPREVTVKAVNGSSGPGPDSAPADPAIREAPVASTVNPPSLSGAETPSIQTGSYTRRANADEMAARLKNDGFEAVIRSVVVRGTTYFRVLIPAPGTVEDARRVMMNLKDKGIESFLIFD